MRSGAGVITAGSNDRPPSRRGHRGTDVGHTKRRRQHIGVVGRGEDETTSVRDQLVKVGLTDVTMKIYPGGRHEMFNEMNREEVYRDLAEWLSAHLPQA